MKKLILISLMMMPLSMVFSQTYNWPVDGNVIYSTPSYNLGIGTNTAPERLSVNGNILATGSISGTSLNVVDIVSSGKEFKINTAICMKGYDPLDPLSRNEICGMNNNLFIQSMNGSNYHTILNYDNTGNVGIGIDNPQYKLDVNGIIRSGKLVTSRITSEDSIIKFGDSTLFMNTNAARLYTDYGGSFKGIGLGNDAKGFGRDALAVGFDTRAIGNNSVAIGYRTEVHSTAPGAITIGSGTPTVRLTNNMENTLWVGFNTDKPTFFVGQSNGIGTYGNVGVGTNVPDAKFHIVNNENTAYNYTLKVTTNNALAKAYSITDNSSGTPTENFLVYGNGTVYCREIFVKLGVLGDFVFDKDYKLMPLKEVENYIEKNHHLPNIPSEEEVKKTDLNVGEMEAKLLQKIEELTLYLIQQNKNIETLQKQLEETQKQLEELKTK